jgi:hypothetical protein
MSSAKPPSSLTRLGLTWTASSSRGSTTPSQPTIEAFENRTLLALMIVMSTDFF